METLAYSQLALSYEEAQEGYTDEVMLEDLLPANFKAKAWLKRGQCCALALGTVAAGWLGTTSNAVALLKQGDRGSEVTRVQQRLQNLNYFEDKPTGYFGDVTENAIKRFQRDRGLKPDGILGPDTEAALFGESAVRNSNSPFNEDGFLSSKGEEQPPRAASEPFTETTARQAKPEVESAPLAASPTLRLRDRGTAVKQLQTRLQAAGFSPGEVDGIYGQQTREAVLAFQRAKGLTVDGIAGQQTLSALAAKSPHSSSQRLYTVTVKSS
jgi:peptidoglycan hydrolase-like protein with peptidoglycan-binding domain